MSRHEILAKGCTSALPKASNLFSKVTHRAAFRFVPEATLFVFVLELFAAGCADALDLFFADDARDRVVLGRDDAVDLEEACDLVVLLDDPRCVRVCGGKATGSEIRSEAPVLTRFDER